MLVKKGDICIYTSNFFEKTPITPIMHRLLTFFLPLLPQACTLPGETPPEDDPFLNGGNNGGNNYDWSNPPVPPNGHAPVMEPISEDHYVLDERGRIELQLKASDEDGDPIAYMADATSERLKEIYRRRVDFYSDYSRLPDNVTLKEDQGLFQWEPACTAADLYTFKFRASDNVRGNERTSNSIDVTIQVNNRCSKEWWTKRDLSRGGDVASDIIIVGAERIFDNSIVFAARLFQQEEGVSSLWQGQFEDRQPPLPGFRSYPDPKNPNSDGPLIISDGTVEHPDGHHTLYEGPEITESTFEFPQNITPQQLRVDTNGDSYIAGVFRSEEGRRLLWFGRFDKDGTMTLNRTIEGVDVQSVAAMTIAMGSPNFTYIAVQDESFRVLKIGAEGSPQWDRTLESLDHPLEGIFGMTVSSVGNVILVGKDLSLVILSSDGEIVSQITYDNLSHSVDVVSDIRVDREGDIVMTGYQEADDGGRNVWVGKFDGETAAELWTDVYDGDAHLDDEGRGLAVDPENNVYVTGFESTPLGGKNLWIRSYDAEGKIIWTEPKDGLASHDFSNPVEIPPLDGHDYGARIAIDELWGSMYIMGIEEGIRAWLKNYRL